MVPAWCSRSWWKTRLKIKRVMHITDIQPKEREYGEGR